MTESAPLCPVHQSPMRQQKSGKWFCPKKVGDAWCDQKRDAAPRAAAPVTTYTGSTPAPQPAGDATLAAAALNAAARIWGVTPPDMHDEVIQTAIRAYSAMKAVL